MKQTQLLLLIAFIFLYFNSKANHLIGGTIEYTYITGSTFDITLKLYRDCDPNVTTPFDGFLNSQIPFAALDVFAITDTGYQFVNELQLVNPIITNITNTPSLINPFIGNIPPICVEEGTYSIRYVFPTFNTKYLITYRRCCRNNTISNIQDPANEGEMVFTIIPAVNNGVNNSATFKNYPISYLCSNQLSTINHAALDADNDSLVYSLCQVYAAGDPIAPVVDYNTPISFDTVNWSNGYHYSYPFGNGTFSINPTSGLITAYPTAIGQYLIGVSVKEYRNDTLIGETRRDIQLNIIACDASPANNKYLANTFDTIKGYGIILGNCQNKTVDFRGFNYQNTGLVSAFWDFGDTTVTTDTITSFSPQYTYPDTGKYLVSITITKKVDTVLLQKTYYGIVGISNDILTPNFSYTSNGTTVQLNNLSTSSEPLFSFWYFDDGYYNYTTNPTHTFSDIKTYYATLTIQNESGCKASITKPINLINDIAENKEDKFVWYCNENYFVIPSVKENYTLVLYDIVGKKIAQKNISVDGVGQVDISQLSHGTYFMAIYKNSIPIHIIKFYK